MVCCREYFRGEKGGGGPGVDIREVFNKKNGNKPEVATNPRFFNGQQQGGGSVVKKKKIWVKFVLSHI